MEAHRRRDIVYLASVDKALGLFAELRTQATVEKIGEVGQVSWTKGLGRDRSVRSPDMMIVEAETDLYAWNLTSFKV